METGAKIVYLESFLGDIVRGGSGGGGELPRSFIEDEWPKLSQAGEVHGYRGPSKKKHNGIVPIPARDVKLLKTLAKLTDGLSDVDLRARCLEGLPVKIVAHVPTGNRLVGYRLRDGTFYILGVGNYNGAVV